MVNVITLGLAQSDHIKLLLLYKFRNNIKSRIKFNPSYWGLRRLQIKIEFSIRISRRTKNPFLPGHRRLPIPYGMTLGCGTKSPDLLINRSGLNFSGLWKDSGSIKTSERNGMMAAWIGIEYGPIYMSLNVDTLNCMMTFYDLTKV